MRAQHLKLCAYKPLLAWQNRIAEWTQWPYLHDFQKGVTQLNAHKTWDLFGTSIDFNNVSAIQWHAFLVRT